MPSHFDLAQALKAKIIINPPLSCLFAGEECLLGQIDANSMTVTFPNNPPRDRSTGHLVVSLNSFLGKSIYSEVVSSSSTISMLKPVKAEDAQTLLTLLTVLRKEQHIKICTDEDVESSAPSTGLEMFRFMPKTLPELAWDEIDTTTRAFDRAFSYPFLITGMTGGVEKGTEINRRLAAAASKFNIPMGVGSQRLALTDSKYSEIFQVKQHEPSLFLIGNLGVNQLKKGQELADCERAIEMIQADALALHVNVLQELIQEEGDRDFRRALDRIANIVERISVPVIIKEVGCGFDFDSAQTLFNMGIRWIDVGGQGGTSWGFIEGKRSSDASTQALGKTFRNWGIPTAYSLKSLRKGLPELNLIATGGIRDGLMVAKAVALGATMTGIGLPLFRAAVASETEPFEVLETMARGLKTAMLCSGSRHLASLQSRIFSEFELTDRFINK